MCATMTDREAVGKGVLGHLAVGLLESWRATHGARAEVMTRCDCCGELMGDPLPDPHWQALLREAKAWQAKVDKTRGRGLLFWPLEGPPDDD